MIRCCRHIKPDGTRCNSPALASQPFCYQHNRLHQASRTTPGKKGRLILRPLEDRRTVLMALSDVICALAAGKIDPNTAARLIYGLQVASQVAAHAPFLVLGKPVESVDFTKTGDEMAPAVLLCTDDDHCETCPDVADCPLKKAVKYRAENGIVSENRQEHDEGEEENRDNEADDTDEDDGDRDESDEDEEDDEETDRDRDENEDDEEEQQNEDNDDGDADDDEDHDVDDAARRSVA